MHGGGSMDGGIKQRMNDVFFNYLGRKVTHGAPMLDGIHHAQGRFGLGGIIGIAHSLVTKLRLMCDLKKMPANSIIDPAMTVTRNFSQNWGYKGGAHRERFRLRNLRESIVVGRCSFGQQ